jgi:ribosomal protein S18 acetylase RimI-like enzyme
MSLTNFERMIQLADDVFATKSDPDQIDINEDVLAHFQKIHPATVSEYDDGNGPVCWILLLPTTIELMNQFLAGAISERELLNLTPLHAQYEAVYLCSAMVLEEYRRKGIAKRLTLSALEQIRTDHAIKTLFVWTFSNEGLLGAEALARMTSLPLLQKGNLAKL